MAEWRGERLMWADTLYGKNLNWLYRCYEIMALFNYQLFRTADHVDLVVFERPRHFSSAKGVAAANEGTVVKLAIMLGMLVGKTPAGSVQFVDAGVWNGQLPKSAMEKRVRSRFPEIKIPPHAADAVGIGLYMLGKF